MILHTIGILIMIVSIYQIIWILLPWSEVYSARATVYEQPTIYICFKFFEGGWYQDKRLHLFPGLKLGDTITLFFRRKSFLGREKIRFVDWERIWTKEQK